MQSINIDTWASGCKVRAFPWIDGELYYVNVRYYLPGSSLAQPAAFDKTVYVTANSNGYKMLKCYLNTLVDHISHMSISPGHKYVLTF